MFVSKHENKKKKKNIDRLERQNQKAISLQKKKKNDERKIASHSILHLERE